MPDMVSMYSRYAYICAQVAITWAINLGLSLLGISFVDRLTFQGMSKNGAL